MNSTTIPYVYLIGWSKLDRWYYGSRRAKGCHPDELWVSYKTSSKAVKAFSKKHGDPDVLEIRKIFDTGEEALMYEHKLLIRINAAGRRNFLNRCNCTPSKPRINDPLPLTAERKALAREITIKQFANTELREFHLQRCYETNAMHIGTIWINNGNVNKRVTPEKFQSEFPDWNKGRMFKDGETIFYEHNERRRCPKTGRYLKKNHGN